MTSKNEKRPHNTEAELYDSPELKAFRHEHDSQYEYITMKLFSSSVKPYSNWVVLMKDQKQPSLEKMNILQNNRIKILIEASSFYEKDSI